MMSASTERIAEWKKMMSMGKIPPRHWTERVSKRQKAEILDKYVEWYVRLCSQGGSLPKRWPHRSMTKRQIEKVYSARGFASADRLGSIDNAKKTIERRTKAENEQREKDAYVSSHGGETTIMVMAEAIAAREKRRAFLSKKSWRKSARRAISFYRFETAPSPKSIEYWTRRFIDRGRWIRRRTEEDMNDTVRSFGLIKRSIEAQAILDSRVINDYWYLRDRAYDRFDFIINLVDEVGKFNAEDYVLTRLDDFRNKLWPEWRKERYVGKSLLTCLVTARIEAEAIISSELSDSIRKSGETSAFASRQLRALGFMV